MFGIFKKKNPEDKLRKSYDKLMQESFDLSKTNRTLSDEKYAEAQKIMDQIESLKSPL